MGWKNIKEHYRIRHIVHIDHGDICIGSEYVPDLIRISPVGYIQTKVNPHTGELARYRDDIEADKTTFRRLWDEPDTFTNALPVYTYERGEILEKLCEEADWPNVTHDGCLMFDTFSTDKDKVIARAKRNAEGTVEAYQESVEQAKRNLADMTKRLAEWESALAQLNATYP